MATPSDPSPAAAPAPPEVGRLIGERYQLEQCLSAPSDGAAPVQGRLWRASDQLAAGALMALRQLGPAADQEGARRRWSQLQTVLHPQVPRFGGAITAGDDLWLVREWQDGRTYQELLQARAERQLVFGAGELLLLLRQLLPVLVALHGQELVHGDLCPANLLRRDRDGQPVLLDFGLVGGGVVATAGYAPPELAQGGVTEPWMDLHALGVTALVLLSGDPPASLLDPVSLAWRWPATLDAEPDLRLQLERLLQRDPASRFASAAQALAALQGLPMPDSTGPVPRADRTLVLVAPAPAAAPAPVAAVALPQQQPPPPPQIPPSPLPGPASPELPLVGLAESATLPAVGAVAQRRSRQEAKEEEAENGVWPVVLALVLSAIVGTAGGWWWLSRGRTATPRLPEAGLAAGESLPPEEVDQRQQLLNRLRAMQVDRAWFLRLVDASLLAQFPERRGRLPSDSTEDAPLRKVWNELAEEWLARVEQLPLAVRRRLGSYSQADWEQRQQALVGQGLSSAVLRQLVSGSAQNLLPGRIGIEIPPEPFRQLWYAAAEQGLAGMRIESIQTRSQEVQALSADVDAGGARLFPIQLPPNHRLVLGVNGSPLMQMTVFAADGSVLEASGPLRVVSLPAQALSPVQLLVTNEGLAPAQIVLSLRADPPPPEPEPEPQNAAPEAAPPAGRSPGSPQEQGSTPSPTPGPAAPSRPAVPSTAPIPPPPPPTDTP
ncbi:protein kinase domain-containing protein [Synechococcus sp. CS-1328]|uniref:protein kinase domain-containing protein n=1 Tax=Synechococcus sp. CS-1328 TaxID=2847976 RepID=UPI00223AE6F9|nr:phosphotransferase [Synechococcus sp. CS-1328]MCT0225025.1 phosphotransferase [Synechococcus sp. CS-1328]